jgi:hypothetical protein
MSDTVNTTVNGVPVTISPAIPVGSGPSGQPAQIQSNQGTGVSRPVIVNFDEPVKDFSVDVVGPSFPGNVVIAYDAEGNEIARVPVTQLYNPWGGDGTTNVTITAPDGTAISRVSLVPAPADYVAYNNIRTGVPVVVPPPPPPDLPPEYQPEPVEAPPVQPLEEPTTGFWFEERFTGSPSVNGVPSLSRLDSILRTAPISTRNIPVIQYFADSNTLAPPMTVRWSRNDQFAAGVLRFNGSTDDGMLIRVNGTTVVESFRDQPPTPFTGEVRIATGIARIEVIYYNDRGPGTAVVNYQLFQDSGVVQQPPVQLPPVPLPPPTPVPLPPLPQRPPVLRLEDIVQFSQLRTERFYVKDSMNSIASETFIVKNVSGQYDVWIEIAEVEGIVPSPRSFLLERNSNKEVQVSFDVVQMNKYPEGVSRITLPIRFTSKVIIVAPEYKLPPTPPQTFAPVLPPPPTFTAPVPPLYVPLPPPTVPTQIPTYEPPSYIPPPLIRTVDTTPFTPPPPPPPPPPRITPTEPQGIWVSGYEGGIRYGSPPAGWVLDPYGGGWYRPDDPFVLSGFGRNPQPTPQVEWIPVTTNTPVLKQNPAPTGIWVSGYEGGLSYGSPPAGWVQEPFGGAWYSPDDPFVLSGWGRGEAPNIPVEEIQPPDTALPLPPPTLLSGGGGGSLDQTFTDMDTFTPSSDLIQAI